MTEHVDNFFRNVKERLASPFFFSFIISWIFWNWKVSVSLLWYEEKHYPNQGDLIRFIDANTSNWYSLILPLASALLYTAIIKNGVSALVTWASVKGEQWDLWISKDTSVPMAKFITYRNLFQKSNEQLSNIINDESRKIEEFDKLVAEKTELMNKVNISQASNSVLDERLKSIEVELRSAEQLNLTYSTQLRVLEAKSERADSFFSTYKDVTVLDGTWKFKYSSRLTNLDFEQTVFLKGGDLYLKKDNNSTIHLQKVIFFFFDSLAKRMFLIFEYLPEISGKHVFDYRDKQPAKDFEDHDDVLHYLRSNSHGRIHVFQELAFHDDGSLHGQENNHALISYLKAGWDHNPSLGV